jgi:serine/threonine protein kinase
MTLPNNAKRKIFDGRYEILSIVGRGADSVVYHGRHITGAAQEVAIKVLINRDGTTTLTDKLRREALTLVSCRHRYVVRLDDFHSIQDLCYLSMEYAPQGDLLKYVATLPDKRLPPAQVALYLRQCLEALDFVHATGVIHRDLKPENILVINDKEIRLADFGLALLPGDEVQLEELRKAVGSFEYLAPEVLDGIKYDTGSDLYSLGVCFYEATTGQHPFAKAPIAEKRDARQDARITPIAQLAPDLPPHVAAVITNLMRFSARDRFQSTSEALRALDDQQFRMGLQSIQEAETIATTQPANDDVTPKFSQSTSPESVFTPSVTQTGSISAASDTEPTPQQPSVQHSDGNAAFTAENQPTPTEKIDLERIKAIIARDTQRRTGGGLSAVDTPATQLSNPAATQAEDISPAAMQTIDKTSRETSSTPVRTSHRKSTSSGFTGTLSPLFTTAIARFVGVALAFALLTVVGIYAYHSLSKTGGSKAFAKGNGPKTIPVTNPDEVAAENDASTEQVESRVMALRSLPEGLYPGTIRGLFPGESVPMALIANPKQQQLTLIIGLEGWMPSTVTLSPEEGGESEGPTFRSNGLILKFNQESSSASINGTIIDVVTGEAGTWKISW